MIVWIENVFSPESNNNESCKTASGIMHTMKVGQHFVYQNSYFVLKHL